MSKDDYPISLKRLMEVLHFDKETGIFTWLVRVNSHVPAGKQAGCHDKDGYLLIGIDGHLYKAHRLAWLYVYSAWPTNHIDHINRNTSDNRIQNLRDASPSQNLMNQKVSRKNTSGRKGVYFSKRDNKWRAQCNVNGKPTYLGSFFTIEEASDMYKKTASKLYGEFFREK